MSSPHSRSSSPRRRRSSSSPRRPRSPIFLTRQPIAPFVVPDLPPEELEELAAPPEVPYFMVRPPVSARSLSGSPRSRSRRARRPAARSLHGLHRLEATTLCHAVL